MRSRIYGILNFFFLNFVAKLAVLICALAWILAATIGATMLGHTVPSVDHDGAYCAEAPVAVEKNKDSYGNVQYLCKKVGSTLVF